MEQTLEWEEAFARLRQWEEVEVPDIERLLRKYGAKNPEDEWLENNDPLD